MGSTWGAAMSGALYVPVLPVRQHATTAYRRLKPEVQAAVAPLWTLPPMPADRGAMSADREEAYWREELRRVTGAHRRHPGWVDAPSSGDAQSVALRTVLSECSEGSPLLRPVTGPGRETLQQAAALRTARRCGHGVGIRVRVPDQWDDATADSVGALLDRFDVPVDLLLDLEAVLPGRPDAGKEALRALDALLPLTAWRTAAVLGGGFPRPTGDTADLGELHEEPRTDWDTWQEIRASGRPWLPRLGYGDHGTQPASALDRAPKKGWAPPWGVLTYTTAASYVLCRVPNRGADRTTGIRATARRIRDLPDFRGAAESAGETWLRDCSEGPPVSGEGTGGPSVWLWVGTVQHMTYVVRCLSG